MKKEHQHRLWDRIYSNGLEWKKEATSLPKLLKNKKVLELGVGNGKTLTSILRQKPKEVHAIDFSIQAIKAAKARFSEKHLFFHHLDLLSMPVEESSFDVIVCYYTLNNLSTLERKAAVKQMHKMLTKGGIVLFEDFAVGDFRSSVMQKTSEKCTFENKGGIQMHFFTEKELKSLFSMFKKSVVKGKSFNLVRSSGKDRRLLSAVFYK